MMEISSRFLTTSDVAEVHDLYAKIASHPGGFARTAEEASFEFVQKTMAKTVAGGVGIGAVDTSSGKLIGFILARKPGPKVFDHVLSELLIGVLPQLQRKGIGRRLFIEFLEHIETSRPDILRVELIVRESNTHALSFYESIGFRREGSFEKRIRSANGDFEADVPMGWLKSGI